MPENKALRWAKFDFWFNGVVVLFYLGLVAWNIERTVNENGWNWIAVVVDVLVLAYFARRAKKALDTYIKIKEEA